MIDLSLLRLMKFRKNFYKLKGRVPRNAMDNKTAEIIDDYGKYFDKMHEHTVIDMPLFLPMYRSWHTGRKEEEANAYEVILRNAAKNIPDNEAATVMRQLLELRLATDLANAAAKFEEGDLPNIHGVIQQHLVQFKADCDGVGKKPIQDDIADLLKEDENNVGIRFRLDVLNKSMRPLRPGDFGIVAARPDRGKTTFLASESTFWGAQLKSEETILWLNNEGMGRRIIPRIYSAALGATKGQLIELSNKGLLKPAFAKRMGRLDRIQIIDIHQMDNSAVQDIIEDIKPAIVIYDMIDNIRGFGDAARTDLKLEQMYTWARDLAAMNNHIAIATSQISADGEGIQFPTQNMLKDSKTGKQGTADFIIMLGAKNDPGFEGLRFVGITKNKLRTDGPGDPRATVGYQPHIARYSDITEAMEE